MKNNELKKLKGRLEQASKSINIKEKNFIDLEKSAESKFLKDIKGYVPHKKYENLKQYLKIITSQNSKINCLVVESEQGIGKTITIKNMLKDLKKDILYINSYSTALSFYKAVYNNKYKHIILDDVYGLYCDEKGIAILRALTNTEKIRYIKYQSTSEKLDVPSSFIFEGSITILTNKITNEMDNSLLGRAIHRKIYFTLNEKFDFMEEIAKFHYKLPEKKLKEILDFIKENVDETTKNFSFRTIIKMIEFYKQKKNWKGLGYEELEKDEELIFVKEIMKLPTEKRNKKWFENTGRSIRTLQRRIEELNNRRQNDKSSEMLNTGERG